MNRGGQFFMTQKGQFRMTLDSDTVPSSRNAASATRALNFASCFLLVLDILGPLFSASRAETPP
jgi:hypothetical protein